MLLLLLADLPLLAQDVFFYPVSAYTADAVPTDLIAYGLPVPTAQLIAPDNSPAFELGGISARIDGLPARVLSVWPDEDAASGATRISLRTPEGLNLNAASHLVELTCNGRTTARNLAIFRYAQAPLVSTPYISPFSARRVADGSKPSIDQPLRPGEEFTLRVDGLPDSLRNGERIEVLLAPAVHQRLARTDQRVERTVGRIRCLTDSCLPGEDHLLGLRIDTLRPDAIPANYAIQVIYHACENASCVAYATNYSEIRYTPVESPFLTTVEGIEILDVQSSVSFRRAMPVRWGLTTLLVRGLDGIEGSHRPDQYPAPAELAGVSVSFGETPARVLLVARQQEDLYQIDVQVPLQPSGLGIKVAYGGKSGTAYYRGSGIYDKLYQQDGYLLAYHSDTGEPLTPGNPLRVGQTFYFFTANLGGTTDMEPGSITPDGAPVSVGAGDRVNIVAAASAQPRADREEDSFGVPVAPSVGTLSISGNAGNEPPTVSLVPGLIGVSLYEARLEALGQFPPQEFGIQLTSRVCAVGVFHNPFGCSSWVLYPSIIAGIPVAP